MVARSRMGDMEDRLGIAPIEGLLAERQQLVERVADLRARHGPFGTWDAMRKSNLATIKMKVRAQAVRDGRKVTEASLEDEAHAHPDYIDFVIVGTRERAELGRAEGLIENIDATIQRANAITRYAAAEAHLS